MKISASKTAAAACIEKIKLWISGCCFYPAVLLKKFLLKLIFRCFFPLFTASVWSQKPGLTPSSSSLLGSQEADFQ